MAFSVYGVQNRTYPLIEALAQQAADMLASDEPCVAAARTTAMLLELGVLFITVVVCAPM